MLSALIRRLAAQAQLLAISSRTSQLLAALSIALAAATLLNAKDLLSSAFETLTRTSDWPGFVGHYWRELATAFGSAVAWSLKHATQYRITRRYVVENFYNDDYGRAVRSGIHSSLRTCNPELVTEPTNDGEAITNPRLNRYLATAPRIPITVNEAPWHAYDQRSGGDGSPDTDSRLLKLLRFVVLNAARRGDFIFNRAKIKVATDLFVSDPVKAPSAIALTTPIALRRTDYFSSVITDGLAFQRITSYPELSSFHLSDGLSSFVANYEPRPNKAELLPLDRARSASQLGASTIAFSRDGRMLLTRVSFRTRYGPGRVSSSGSGSLNWSDIKESGCDDLLGIVRYGALRELTEECGLQRDRLFGQAGVRADLLPLAFYRLIHRGGKPEFICIGFIDANYEEITKRALGFLERLFTATIDVPDTPTVNLGSRTLVADIARECDRFLHKREAEQSFGSQLYLGLRLLSRAADNRAMAEAIEAFFRRQVEGR